jgi:exopolyphosphatase/guanosine-5'-triphosphate,3'-diphosphate pyrophosphatase
MGSNSFRLVVYGWHEDGPWMLLDEIREAVRIGAGVASEGRLAPDRVEHAVATAEVFAAFCRASGVDEIDAVGTSAIRDAENRDEFIDAVRERTGIEVRVISGEEEARYGWLAIANSTTVDHGFGLDMGGGSIQLMRLEDRHLADAVSLPLGAVRVSERFLSGEEASKKDIKALRKHVARELEEIDWFGGGGRLAGIGGGLRNLAAAAQKMQSYPEIGVGGFHLTADALDELVDQLAELPASKRAGVPGIKPDRGDVILGAALVLAEVMKRGGFDSIEVSEAGLREGIFFECFLADHDEPLLEDVRAQSVLNMARRFHWEGEHLDHVASLSEQLYDGLVENGLRDGDDWERELLWAACMLHDVGAAIDYDDHHKHSRYLVLNAGLPGFEQRVLYLVALLTRYHRKGDPDASEMGPLAKKTDDERLELLSSILRLAEQLERSRDGSVKALSVHADDGVVRIEARTKRDERVAIWSARRNADLLERALGKKVEIERA